MRLAYVVHQFLPRYLTGTEQYVRSLAHGMQARGHRVEVLAYAPQLQHEAQGRMAVERDEDVEGIPVRRIGVHPDGSPNPKLADYENPLAGALFGRFLDARAAAGAPFDVVHVIHPRLLGSAAITEPKSRRLPVAVHLMDFWFLCPNFMLLRRGGELCDGPPEGGLGCVPCIDPGLGSWLQRTGLAVEARALGERSLAVAGLAAGPARSAHALVARQGRLFGVLQQADAIVAPSRFLQQKFEAAGFPRGRIRHLPYGIDGRRIAGVTPRGGSGLEVGFLGSLAPHKGLHVLLEAARGLPGDGFSVAVHGDPATHPEYSGPAQAAVAGDRRFRFCGAFPSDRLGAVLQQLDVVVVPSLWYENTPFTVLETLAAGRIVVASDLGGIREIVGDGENGLLFPAGDAGALRACLQRLLDDPTLRARLAQKRNIRPLANNLDDFEELYRDLVARRRQNA
jgi:glycosyltransferase involved in cell wall biosynthesis